MAQSSLAGACGTPNRDAPADGWSVVHSKGSLIYKPKLYKQLQTLGVSLQSSPYGQKLVALYPSTDKYIELLSPRASSGRQSDHAE
jgi:hypothetical protein